MITILYAYRNREIARIQQSLESLSIQGSAFRVVFVDYGSEQTLASRVKTLVESYPFATYVFHPTNNQPWNKCKALNSVIKNCNSTHCFVADVDMIFHPDFITTLVEESKKEIITYFQVGFLNEKETQRDVLFEEYKVTHISEEGATGMTLFPVKALNEIRGFDEFFHFWGGEDTDIHNRLKKGGHVVQFYTEKLLMLHQWHPSYRKRETRRLSQDLQLSNIVRINYTHMLTANSHDFISNQNWGEILTQEEYQLLENTAVTVTLLNRKEIVDHFLFSTLHHFKDGILSVKFEADSFQKTLKYKAKKLLGKTVPEYYSLKEINDKLLLHIISFYHQFPYSYQVSNDLKSIVFKIKK